MKILIAPLNWGLGHATRCVPLIRKELTAGNEVVIAADGYPLRFLREEFPDLRYIEMGSYPIRYASGNSQVGAMLRFLPKLIQGVRNEHRWLAELLTKERFDRVISDNRFGLWNKKVHSVYMTHQIMVKMPKRLRFLERPGYLLHKKLIEKFDACLIPDDAAHGGLSGDLSHKYPLPKNAVFIGPLSRFDGLELIADVPFYDTVILLSGVEPQRSIFEKEMIDKYSRGSESVLLLRGKPDSSDPEVQIGRITVKNHIPSSVLGAHLKNCRTIVARSGYSTIMDLSILGVLDKAHFHPTPGQTEQEYLAKYHAARLHR